MAATTTRDPLLQDAIESSRGCPYCDGAGLVAVYDPRYAGRAVGTIEVRAAGEAVRRHVAFRVMAHCLCKMGRWMRGRLTTDEAKGIPDYQDVLAGRTRWLAHDPTEDHHVT